MATITELRKKKTQVHIKVDKRSKAYREGQKEYRDERGKPVAYTSVKKQLASDVLWGPATRNECNDSVVDVPWNIHNLINDIRSQIESIRFFNSRLTSCVNSIVYIERKVDDTLKDKVTKRSNTVTDNLDELKWQLKEISDTYYDELGILENYIGNISSNTNKQ